MSLNFWVLESLDLELVDFLFKVHNNIQKITILTSIRFKESIFSDFVKFMDFQTLSISWTI